jgi:single-strand DNA-binding protein
MNEITIHGNVTSAPELRLSRDGNPFATFSVAVNRRRFNRGTGRWADLPPVFHRVVCFKKVAENVAASLVTGATVTVTGELADDSYAREDGTQVRATQLVAEDVAVSLRYATATLTKNTRTDTRTDTRAAVGTDDGADTNPSSTDPADAPSPARTTARGRTRELSVVGSD